MTQQLRDNYIVNVVSIYFVLTDIFYLMSFESSAFHRGSNLFPLVYRIAEAIRYTNVKCLLEQYRTRLSL